MIAEELNKVSVMEKEAFNAEVIGIRVCEFPLAQSAIAVVEHIHFVPNRFNVVELLGARNRVFAVFHRVIVNR